MNRRPRILLADDHTMLLDAFLRLLEPQCEIVGTAGDGRTMIELALKTKAEIIILRWQQTLTPPPLALILRTSTN
jgi:DNA-binding NarL/FixJ family response regulator